MTTPTIGTYTEKRITNQITNLIKRIDELESFIKKPPCIVIQGIMDIPSEFSNDWKLHLTHILNTVKVNDHWILAVKPNKDVNVPCFITLQLISHCVKEIVFDLLYQYITINEFEGVIISKDAV